MAGWIRQRPAGVWSLEAMQDLLQTDAARRLARAYAGLMRAANPPGIPAKNGLDLTEFAAIMPHLVLCAIDRSDRCVYRLAGEAVQQRIGFNPVGRNYYDFVPSARRETARRAMAMTVEQPCGFRALVAQHYSDGRDRVIECLAVPLTALESGVQGFILFSDSEVGRAPPLARAGTLLGAEIARRDLIDLGYGVDDTFEDVLRSAV
ncbi:MAG: hypothetical protein NXI21_10330 [Alphaproteobacteria bacterium]|nr:hypothetical protein [Alphaproteobacteria bacterium]